MRRTVRARSSPVLDGDDVSQGAVELIARQLEQNRLVIGAYGEQFELGQRSLLDLLDVQNELFVNETTLTTESFVSQYNVYRVLAAMAASSLARPRLQRGSQARAGSFRCAGALIRSAR